MLKEVITDVQNGVAKLTERKTKMAQTKFKSLPKKGDVAFLLELVEETRLEYSLEMTRSEMIQVALCIDMPDHPLVVKLLEESSRLELYVDYTFQQLEENIEEDEKEEKAKKAKKAKKATKKKKPAKR